MRLRTQVIDLHEESSVYAESWADVSHQLQAIMLEHNSGTRYLLVCDVSPLLQGNGLGLTVRRTENGGPQIALHCGGIR